MDKRVFAVDKKVYIIGDIDYEAEAALIEIIKSIEKTDIDNEKKETLPIELYINSTGGNVSSAFSIFNTITECKTDINTYVLSEASSSGMIIYLAGKKRFIYKNAFLMLHSVSCGIDGKTGIIKNAADHLQQLHKFEIQMITSKTKLTEAEIENVFNSNNERYFYSEECLKLGLATKLI